MLKASLFVAAILIGVPSSTAIAGASTPSSSVGRIFRPAEQRGRAPGILVLGGSEGGSAWAEKTARMLADYGFVAEALAYFKASGLPDQLQQIPLERFTAGIDQLASDPQVDHRRIAILGLSKGAEAALLVASRDGRIRAVVAGSPSDRVWQGIDRKAGTVASSWSERGRPLPFTPFAPCPGCTTLASLYVASRDADGTAVIPVWSIRAPILMLASDHDGVWPSQAMAAAIEHSLAAHHFRYPVSTLHYPDGGHFTLGPRAAEEAEGDAGFGGGTAAGVVQARTDSWARVLAFLDEALRKQR